MAGFGTILGQGHVRGLPGPHREHPSRVLPSFKGLHGRRDVLDDGVKVTGGPVHVATAEVDDGPILAQAAVAVQPDDAEASLHERIKVVERQLYVQTIKEILERGSVQ